MYLRLEVLEDPVRRLRFTEHEDTYHTNTSVKFNTTSSSVPPLSYLQSVTCMVRVLFLLLLQIFFFFVTIAARLNYTAERYKTKSYTSGFQNRIFSPLTLSHVYAIRAAEKATTRIFVLSKNPSF